MWSYLLHTCRKILELQFSSLPRMVRSNSSFSTWYSHLSNKREVRLTDCEKKKPPSTFIDFLDFFPPSTPRLLQLYPSFFQKIPPSTIIPTSSAIREMRVRLHTRYILRLQLCRISKDDIFFDFSLSVTNWGQIVQH